MIEQTRTKPEETLENKMNKQMQTFSLFSPIILSEEGKWVLGVTSFECTISVFNKTNNNNSFSVSTPGQWRSEEGEEFIDRLNRVLNGRSYSDFKLHVQEVGRRGQKIKIGDKKYMLSHLIIRKNEINKELKTLNRTISRTWSIEWN